MQCLHSRPARLLADDLNLTDLKVIRIRDGSLCI